MLQLMRMRHDTTSTQRTYMYGINMESPTARERRLQRRRERERAAETAAEKEGRLRKRRKRDQERRAAETEE